MRLVVLLGLWCLSVCCVSVTSAAEYPFDLAPGESRKWTVDLATTEAATVRLEKNSCDLRFSLKSGSVASKEISSSRYSSAPVERVILGETLPHTEVAVSNPSAGGQRCDGRILIEPPHPVTEVDRKRFIGVEKMEKAQALERDPAAAASVRGAWLEAIALLADSGDAYALTNARRALAFWLMRQQDFAGAREEFMRAMELMASHRWRFEECSVRQNLAHIHTQMGEHVLAIQEQKAVLQIRNELHDEYGKALALFGLGVTAWRMGAYQDALDYYRQSLALWRNLGERGWQAQVANAMGLLDVSLGRLRGARSHYREALSIWQQLHDERNSAMVFNNEGLLNSIEGDGAKATELFRTALATFEKVRDRQSMAYTLQNLGDVDANAGNHKQALELYARSLRLKEEIGDKKGQASAHTRSALSYLALKQSSDAEKEIRLALDIAKSTSDREEEAQAHGAMARLHLQEKAYQRAEGSIAEAVRLIESTRLELRARDTRAGYFSTRRDYYDLAMDVAAAQGTPGLEKSWTWSERARARTLLDTIQRAGVDIANSPETIVSFDRLRKELLGRGTVLVQYSVSPQRTLAWVIDGASARLVQLPGSDALKHALDEADAGRLEPIAEAIWKPVAVRGSYRTIIIAPEGGLERIPFAALPTTQGKPIVAESEIVNIPSASLLLARRKTQEKSPGASAVFADPVFSPADIRVKSGAADKDSYDGLPRLRFSREEATSLLKILGPNTQLALDFDASRDRLRTAAAISGPLLHIASHAVVEENEPSRSRIVLSQVSPSGTEIRGNITLDEIFSMKIRKELVVLSACSTADGAEIRGEGVMSFARAFLYAGARGLVATLYPVEDRASSEFVNRFYRAMLGSSLSPATALRRAQLEMRADPRWKDPHVWAAFALFGDWELHPTK